MENKKPHLKYGFSFSTVPAYLRHIYCRSLQRPDFNVLLISDAKTFGLDITGFRGVFRINNQNYASVRQIHKRNSVLGRATAVYSVRGT